MPEGPSLLLILDLRAHLLIALNSIEAKLASTTKMEIILNKMFTSI